MSALTKILSTDKGINITNIVLMILSTMIAFFVPFHAFILAYAVLGPLHYLTEISWLEKRDFFGGRKYDVILFILIAGAFTYMVFDEETKLANYSNSLMLITLVFALCMVFVSNVIVKYAIVIVLFLVLTTTKFDDASGAIILLGVLLPTLIHVFVFTGIFILAGAIKNKSLWGFISLGVFALCACSFFFINFNFNEPSSSMMTNGMEDLGVIHKGWMWLFANESSKDIFDFFRLDMSDVMSSQAGVMVGRFVAFAYTYHYLNWFSKTTVIKWHEVSKQRLWVIALLWLLSVGIYFYDYHTGYLALFFLSMFHVFCEFPLNIQTIKGIGISVFSRK